MNCRRLLALISLAVITASPIAAAADRAGEVLAIKGQCAVEPGKAGESMKVGDTVWVGDTIILSDGAKVKLQMIDGSVIAAGSNSRLTIEKYGKDGSGQRDVALRLAAGLLRAVVAPAEQPSRFEATTATGVAAVRSTDWFIEAGAELTVVGVLSGEVSLTSLATGHQVEIPARWGARIIGQHDPVRPRLWTQDEFADVIARTDLN